MTDILLSVMCMLMWVYCRMLEERITRIEEEFMVDK